jgi:hypothetical protein
MPRSRQRAASPTCPTEVNIMIVALYEMSGNPNRELPLCCDQRPVISSVSNTHLMSGHGSGDFF